MGKITSFRRLFSLQTQLSASIFLLLFSMVFVLSSFAQAQNPITINWVGGVGCQEYGNIEDTRGKDILIENIEDSLCFRICENATVNYQLANIPSGSTVIWNVIGGITLSSSNTNCNVKWGASGFGSVSFQIISNGNSISKTICIEKIIGPTADFIVIPENEISPDLLVVCAEQTIYFTNLSQANGGTAIVSYFWDFGDGTYSNAENPTHIYQSSNIYDVTLKVTNACNCSSSYRMRVVVEDKGFDIQCASIVCEGQQATYTLPFDAEKACKGNYNWSVVGGQIENIGPNGDLSVLWNNVDSSGFGYVTFNPVDCDVKCYNPTTIRVPVIMTQGVINGPTEICSDQATI